VPAGIKTALYAAIVVSQFLCGLATVTSISRMMFAFSRDGGLPFSKALASVSPKYRTPVHAIWWGSILSVLFVWGSKALETGGVTPVYTIVVSCTVIFLFFSFAIPIALGLFAHGTSKWPTMGPWDLGPAVFKLFAFLSIVAMVLIFVIGVQPPNDMAARITLGFLVLTAVIWFGLEKRRFQGPPIGDMIKRRQAEIAAAEAKLSG
jgi:amino acid transporter